MTIVTINIRIGKNEKAWFKEMAKLKHMTLSGFLRDAARIEAHRVLGPPQRVDGQAIREENP
jgi:uncharacterized protein (DUF1778 family)